MNKISKTWWGRRFLDVLEKQTDSGRLSRGRQYLASNQIRDISINGTAVSACIRGKVNPYYGVHEAPVYHTRIKLTAIPHSAWDEALTLIGSRAGYISRLLFNEMPDEIELPLDELGVSLLPVGSGEITSDCSCPDIENPCKHIAALYYMLATRLDQDPFLLFELRGLSRTELISRLKSTPLGTALASALDETPARPQPAESFFTRPIAQSLPDQVCPRQFWRGQRKLPAGVEHPPPAAISGILIRKGGDYPPFWERDQSFVEVMDLLYEQIRKKGKEWL